MLSESIFIREIPSKRFLSHLVSLSLPTYYLEAFRGYSELIKIAEKSCELLSEMNKNHRNSRLRTRPSCAPLNTSDNSRVAHNSSTVNTRRRHLFPLLPPPLSSRSISFKKKRRSSRQLLRGGWHWRCSISWLGFLRRRASLNSHWARSSFRNGKSDAIRVQYTRSPLPLSLFLLLSFRLFRSFSRRHT